MKWIDYDSIFKLIIEKNRFKFEEQCFKSIELLIVIFLEF